MKIAHQVVVFDAADLAAESSFWAGVLGGTVDADDDWPMVEVDGRPRIGVQLAPDHVAPDWPDGTPQQTRRGSVAGSSPPCSTQPSTR